MSARPEAMTNRKTAATSRCFTESREVAVCIWIIMKKQTDMKKIFAAATLLCCVLAIDLSAQKLTVTAGREWKADDGEHINCHGGNILRVGDTFYWYGEHRVETIPGASEDGIACYSSRDLVNWHNEGLVLTAVRDTASDIALGCIMERPKVLSNPKTGKYVMLFHLELRGRGYGAARVAFAEAESPKGPFRFIRSLRPNPSIWPKDFGQNQKDEARSLCPEDYKTWWTPEWREAVAKGLFLVRDMPGGQMSRDMTVYQDEDGTAYHVYSSEENLTLHLAELTPDYLDYTGRFVRIAAGGQNEAPTLFKKDGFYWLITSGCTGWAPNRARMFRAKSLWGPWEACSCPSKGEGAETTFGAQGTYIMENPYRPGSFIFMADQWRPKQLSKSLHLWLPIEWEDGKPVLKYRETWALQE